MFELDCFNARDFREDPAYLAMFGDRAALANEAPDSTDTDPEQEAQR